MSVRVGPSFHERVVDPAIERARQRYADAVTFGGESVFNALRLAVDAAFESVVPVIQAAAAVAELNGNPHSIAALQDVKRVDFGRCVSKENA